MRERIVIKKKILGGLGVALILLSVILWRSHPQRAVAKKTETSASLFNPKRFRLDYVKRRDLNRWAVVPGVVHAFRKAEVFSHVPGYLKFLNVDKGDIVHKSQVLAYIFDPELYQRYQKELAEAEIARITFERKKQVWEADHRVISL